MDPRRLVLLVLAVLFIVVGALLFRSSGEDGTKGARAGASEAPLREERVVYPRERKRRPVQKAPAPHPKATAAPDERPAPQKDAIEAVMAGREGGAVFVEVNAIRHSDLVEKILRCRKEEAIEGLERMKQELGIDPSRDVDRFALAEDAVAVSGFFDELKVPEELGEGEAYGDDARIFAAPDPEDESRTGAYIGIVGKGLIVMAESEEAVRGMIDRAEGRAEAEGALPPELRYSEIYGRIGPGLFRAFLRGAQDPVAKELASLVTGGTVRINVDDAVTMSLDLETESAEVGEDLAKAVGGAFAALRQKAELEGEHELSRLLEQARVLPGEDGKFGVDLAVPGELVLKMMGCDGESAKAAH